MYLFFFTSCRVLFSHSLNIGVYTYNRLISYFFLLLFLLYAFLLFFFIVVSLCIHPIRMWFGWAIYISYTIGFFSLSRSLSLSFLPTMAYSVQKTCIRYLPNDESLSIDESRWWLLLLLLLFVVLLVSCDVKDKFERWAEVGGKPYIFKPKKSLIRTGWLFFSLFKCLVLPGTNGDGSEHRVEPLSPFLRFWINEKKKQRYWNSIESKLCSY